MNINLKAALTISYLFISICVIYPKDSNKSTIQNYIFPKDKVKIAEYKNKTYVGITITNIEVQKAEKLFEKYLRSLDPNLLLKLNSYKRQYVGISSQGRKIIYINFAKSTAHRTPKDWEEELFFTFDGGSDYMNVKVNIDDNFCYDFSVNGEA